MDVRVVEPVDPGVEDRDPDVFPCDAHRPHRVGPDRGNALVQQQAAEGETVVPQLAVEVNGSDTAQPGHGIDLGGRGERRYELEMLELNHTRAEDQKCARDHVPGGRGFIIVDDHDETVRGSCGRERGGQRGIEHGPRTAPQRKRPAVVGRR